MDKERPRLVLARATVNLSGFRVGQRRYVDPDHPEVAALLRDGFLVAEAEDGDE